MTESSRPLRVFLCHAHSDAARVHALYDRLTRDGVDAWLDKEKLLPGQDWELEIRKAVRESDAVLVCLSKQFNQAGFRQKEVRIALDEADKQPPGHIYIIPVRLEDCETPEHLQKWHWVDLFESNGYEMLRRALKERARQKGIALQFPDGEPSASSSREKPRRPSSRPPADARPKPKPAEEPSPAPLSRDQQVADYNEGRALQNEGNLAAAAALFEKVGDYRDAPLRLRKLRLYLEADQWMKTALADKEERAEPWQEARQRLEELLQLDPQFLDAPARLETVNRWLALPATYERLLDALDVHDWNTAFSLFLQIQGVKPTYKRTQSLFEMAWLQIVQAGANRIVARDGKEMMFIPAGEFLMGSDKGDSDERPPHTVYLDAYYIDRYPVTNAEYKKFIEATGRRPPSHWENGKIPAGKENHPVVNVSWHDAAAYAEWAGKRLPTEAEWEKAASWDEVKRQKRVYPWGDRFEAARCNSKESGLGTTTPVGTYSPQGDSWYGVADMAGNVWEWCADCYDEGYYKNSPARNPRGPNSGSSRVLRGGSWYYDEYFVRSANRYGNAPGSGDGSVGFRCALSP